jgi:hypothetical protein
MIKGGLADRWHHREIDGGDLYGVIDEARRIGIPGLARRRHGASDTQARAMGAASQHAGAISAQDPTKRTPPLGPRATSWSNSIAASKQTDPYRLALGSGMERRPGCC